MDAQDTGRRLIWHGIFLFLLGLLTGFVVQQLTNPRMGLTSHLEGLMNGMFLVLLGLIWSRVRLGPAAATMTFWLALYGTYVNWGSTLLAALWGTSLMSPIAGAGYGGSPWQESIVNFGLISLSVAMVGCCVILLWGLRRSAAQKAVAP